MTLTFIYIFASKIILFTLEACIKEMTLFIWQAFRKVTNKIR